jgi:hypothetical protein
MMHLAILALAASPVCDVPPTARAPAFEAARLREGRFTYSLEVDGKPAGQFVLNIRRQPSGDWRFTGDALGFDQHWEAVTDQAFRPKSAVLELKRHGEPYRMELAYEGEKVAVSETAGPAADLRRSQRRIEIPTVDQRIDWASMMAADLEPGSVAAYHVFDAMTGSSRLLASAGTAPAMDGPLGRQEVVRLDYRICKDGRPEPYTVYATRSLPRVMLREDLRGHEVATLVKVEP